MVVCHAAVHVPRGFCAYFLACAFCALIRHVISVWNGKQIIIPHMIIWSCRSACKGETI